MVDYTVKINTDMRNIKPVLWKRNAPNATKIRVHLVYDNLCNTCTTFWQILSDDSTILDQDNITIDGDDYQNWDGSNDFVYDFIASKLSIEFDTSYGAGLGTENI
jgi:hypothetical protein